MVIFGKHYSRVFESRKNKKPERKDIEFGTTNKKSEQQTRHRNKDTENLEPTKYDMWNQMSERKFGRTKI